ncbi:hypothetical protein AVEN_158554-1 [Araneus ventricosus]|uniref:Uncharacterized protein n=1 Tax=Araneus ventricosus TaxID=182803 RepID=A0A4Y2S4Z2_ARAVE|nr:hypothetical protein AVEN_158554-1 [Araneus ventricosus]
MGHQYRSLEIHFINIPAIFIELINKRGTILSRNPIWTAGGVGDGTKPQKHPLSKNSRCNAPPFSERAPHPFVEKVDPSFLSRNRFRQLPDRAIDPPHEAAYFGSKITKSEEFGPHFFLSDILQTDRNREGLGSERNMVEWMYCRVFFFSFCGGGVNQLFV